MKVLFLTTSFPTESNPLSGIFVAKLVQSFPSDSDITILTPRAACKSTTLCVDDQIHRVVQFPYFINKYETLAHSSGGIPQSLRSSRLFYLIVPLFLLSMLFYTVRLSRSCHILHANWSVCGLIAGIAGRIRGIPVVTTLRGEDYSRANESFLFRWILIWCLKLSAKVVTVSEAMKNGLRQKFIRESLKIECVPNGVDMKFIRIGQLRRSRQNYDVIRVITVGSLIQRKGIHQILDALELLQCKGIEFRIVGEGPEEDFLKTRILSNSKLSCVKFLGNVAPESLPLVLGECDVFVLASYSEGRPNVLLEAMAAGLPVIATNIDGVKELVSEMNGFLFEPNDSSKLAEFISIYQNDIGLMLKHGRKSYQLILDNDVSWSNTAYKYLNVYKSLLPVVCI